MKRRNIPLLLSASLFLHLIWLVLFLYLIWAGPFQNDVSSLDRLLLRVGCETCVVAGDSIRTAYEMGRLEIVSMSLTLLATVIGVGAFFGFFLVRSAAKDAAADEAVEMVNRKLPDMLNNVDVIGAILKNDRFRLTLVTEVLRLAQEQGLVNSAVKEDEAANRIAEAIAETTDEQG